MNGDSVRADRIAARNRRWFPAYHPIDRTYSIGASERLDVGGRVLHLGSGRDSLGIVDRLVPLAPWVVSVDLDLHGLRLNSNRRRVLASGDRLPFPSGEFDMVLTENVFEHLDEPAGFLHECRRCLKDGGYLMFMCPNRFGYVSIVAALTPHWVHEAFKARAMHVASSDTFPTRYRLNTARAIRRSAGRSGFDVEWLQTAVGWPTYWEFSDVLHRAFVVVHRVLERLPSWFHITLVGALRADAARAETRPERGRSHG